MQAWLGGKSNVFLILLTFGGRCNRCFWDIWLKILRLPNFNMLFQLVLTKFFKSESFCVYWKLIMWSQSCKEPTRLRHTVLQFCLTCCLDDVCKVLWHLNESLRRKLLNYASNKLQLGLFSWFTCTKICVCWLGRHLGKACNKVFQR